MKTLLSPHTPWHVAFNAWLSYVEQTRTRADAITRRQHDRGWALAASVGIPRCRCSLHNAAIDDAMTGWCRDNPAPLAIAKQAARLVDDWRASCAADRMTAREREEYKFRSAGH